MHAQRVPRAIQEGENHHLKKFSTTAKSKSTVCRFNTLTELEVPETGCNAVEYVLDTLKTLIAQEREVLRLAADAGDEATVALMSDYLKEQEKTVWMLVAFNSPKCAK